MYKRDIFFQCKEIVHYKKHKKHARIESIIVVLHTKI